MTWCLASLATGTSCTLCCTTLEVQQDGNKRGERGGGVGRDNIKEERVEEERRKRGGGVAIKEVGEKKEEHR